MCLWLLVAQQIIHARLAIAAVRGKAFFQKRHRLRHRVTPPARHDPIQAIVVLSLDQIHPTVARYVTIKDESRVSWIHLIGAVQSPIPHDEVEPSVDIVVSRSTPGPPNRE